MGRAALATTAALAVALLGGCGTVRNLSYVITNSEADASGGFAYGGVAFDVGASSICVRSAIAGETPFTVSRENDLLMAVGLLAVDLPLSLAGDTLSLPVFLAAALKRQMSGGQAVPRGATEMASDVAAGEK